MLCVYLHLPKAYTYVMYIIFTNLLKVVRLSFMYKYVCMRCVASYKNADLPLVVCDQNQALLPIPKNKNKFCVFAW